MGSLEARSHGENFLHIKSEDWNILEVKKSRNEVRLVLVLLDSVRVRSSVGHYLFSSSIFTTASCDSVRRLVVPI